jgi:class 3 adenylate cyclase
MLMVFALASTIRDIHLLKKGRHHLDTLAGFRQMTEDTRTDINFRAGLETGSAMIGPLGSEQRKIVTAIGEGVNTASRLESTGVKAKLHVSKTIREILNHACISRDTPMARQRIPGARDPAGRGTPVNFFDAYKTHFGLTGNVVEKHRQVSYKEFSPGPTYLIRCIPDPVEFSAGTCGI